MRYFGGLPKKVEFQYIIAAVREWIFDHFKWSLLFCSKPSQRLILISWATKQTAPSINCWWCLQIWSYHQVIMWYFSNSQRERVVWVSLYCNILAVFSPLAYHRQCHQFWSSSQQHHSNTKFSPFRSWISIIRGSVFLQTAAVKTKCVWFL